VDGTSGADESLSRTPCTVVAARTQNLEDDARNSAWRLRLSGPQAGEAVVGHGARNAAGIRGRPQESRPTQGCHHLLSPSGSWHGTRLGPVPTSSMWRDVNCFNEMRIPALTYGPGVSSGGGRYAMSIENMILGTKNTRRLCLISATSRESHYLHWTITRNGRFTRLCWRLLPCRSDRWQPPERAAESASPRRAIVSKGGGDPCLRS
jgi:hypothetical protein